MGINAKVEDMIHKLEVQYGQLVSGDVLFQTFYQMMQEKE